MLKRPFTQRLFYLLLFLGFVTALGLDFALWHEVHWRNLLGSALVSLIPVYFFILVVNAYDQARS